MDPVTLGFIASLLGTGYSIFQGNKAGKKQEEYVKRQEAHQKELEAKAEKERRKEALARVLKTSANVLNPPNPSAPTAPDLTGYQTRGALGGLLAQLGAQGMAGTFDKYFQPKKIDMPYDYNFSNLKGNTNYSPMGG